MLRVGSLKRKQTGQTTCKDCGKKYNNACVPPSCQCGYMLGGNFKPPGNVKKPPKDAQLILNGLVSVRLNQQGANIRIFVNMTENKVCTYKK